MEDENIDMQDDSIDMEDDSMHMGCLVTLARQILLATLKDEGSQRV
jgi:hypothetical protein